MVGSGSILDPLFPYINPLPCQPVIPIYFIVGSLSKQLLRGAWWLSRRVLVLRLKGRCFQTHQWHISKTLSTDSTQKDRKFSWHERKIVVGFSINGSLCEQLFLKFCFMFPKLNIHMLSETQYPYAFWNSISICFLKLNIHMLSETQYPYAFWNSISICFLKLNIHMLSETQYPYAFWNSISICFPKLNIHMIS